jgi:hypothetical protein
VSVLDATVIGAVRLALVSVTSSLPILLSSPRGRPQEGGARRYNLCGRGLNRESYLDRVRGFAREAVDRDH